MQANENEKSSNEKEKLEIARKNFDKIMREISPYIKKRGTRVDSTSEGWIVTSETKLRQANK